jgi:hypothetical protein
MPRKAANATAAATNTRFRGWDATRGYLLFSDLPSGCSTWRREIIPRYSGNEPLCHMDAIDHPNEVTTAHRSGITKILITQRYN